jgi:hypothetical protein
MRKIIQICSAGDRDRVIIDALRGGHSYTAIAGMLSISPSRVRKIAIKIGAACLCFFGADARSARANVAFNNSLKKTMVLRFRRRYRKHSLTKS